MLFLHILVALVVNACNANIRLVVRGDKCAARVQFITGSKKRSISKATLQMICCRTLDKFASTSSLRSME